MKSIRTLALAGASLLSVASPAFAQDATAQDPAEVGADGGDIIVTARRKDESIQDVPLSVNAVSADTLEKLNIRDFKDITSVVPGLQLAPGNAVTGQVSSLRGLNFDNTASGNNGTVEFYLNDAPISSGAVLQTMFDVGQIEVLRGPQGTLRGRASPSGSITITTRRPDLDEIGGYAQGTVNNIGTFNMQGAVNVPLIEDVLAVRVAGMAQDDDANRVTSIYQNDGPRNKSRGFRVSARLAPIDGLEINASYGRLVKDSLIFDQVESAALATGGAVVGKLITPKDRLSVLNVPRTNRVEYDMFNWQAQYSFYGQRLTYVGSVTKQDLTMLDPQDKGDFFDASYPGDSNTANINETTYSANLQNAYNWQHSYPKQETHELRLQSEERIIDIFDYVVGGLYSKLAAPTDLNSFRAAIFAGSVAPANYVGINSGITNRGGRNLEQSFYGNLTAHFGERAEISGGVRHINYQENANGPNNTFNKWVWNASAKFRATEDLMVYATAGSSFRLGSGSTPLILARSMSLSTIVDPLLLSMSVNTPETSESYEIGLKSTWFDNTVTFNVAAFHQDFSNFIFSTAPIYVIPNVGTTSAFVAGNPTRTVSGVTVPVPAKVDGVEVELGVRPSSDFSAGLNLAYAKSKMNTQIPCTPASPPASNPPTVADIQNGNPTQQVARCTVNQSAARTPELSGNIQAEYSHPINGDYDGFVRGLVNFSGKNKNDPGNPYDDVSAYAIGNLYIGVRDPDGAWEVTAYGKNIFNTFRVLTRDQSAAGVTTSLGTRLSNYRVISVTDPREFGITARFAFGSR